MFLIILFTICVLLVAFYTFINDHWRKRGVSEESGFFWNMFIKRRSLPEFIKDVYDKHPNLPYIGSYIANSPVLVIKDLDNIQAIMAGDFQSFNSRGINTDEKDVLADNLLFMEDYRKWKLIRQKISPVFTNLKLKNMFYILEQCGRDFVEFVATQQELVNKKPFNSLYTYTTASIGAAVFGIDTKTKNSMDSPFLDMAWKVLNPSLKSSIASAITNSFPWVMKYIRVGGFFEFESFFVGTVKKVLEDRKQTGEKRYDFIDICVDLQNLGVMQDASSGYSLEPTDEILAAQAFFFFIAGADTSANSINFTLLELSRNKKVLLKVHQEIDRVFESCDGKLTFNAIEDLKYLEMSLNEALRKYPPIGIIQRRCTKTTVLPVGQLKVEAGSIILLPALAIHRDEKYYPEPEKFDPDRFLSENLSKIPKFGYLPFGEGNRACIGTRFARLQVLVGLAWLLRKFTLREIPHETRFEASFFAIRDPDAKYEIVPRESSEKNKFLFSVK